MATADRAEERGAGGVQEAGVDAVDERGAGVGADRAARVDGDGEGLLSLVHYGGRDAPELQVER